MKYIVAGVVVLCMIGTAFGGVVHVADAHGEDESEPFAEAGLDQQGQIDQPVLLDGSGSWSPDGTISGYEWEIEAPDGTTATPVCSDCSRTEFVPEQNGEYAVELTVADDRGGTDTDTMYVSVDTEPRLDVSLSGETAPTVGEEVSYTGSVESNRTTIDTVEWRLNEDVIAPDEDVGDHLRTTETFSSPGENTIELVVTDETGRVATDTLDISVRADGRSSGPSVFVDGDQLITGERPLVGEYEIAGHDSGSVGSVRWYADDEVVGTDNRTTVEWEPGIHELYAIVEHDGGTHRVTFADGDEVVADPTPEIDLDVEREGDTVTGTAVATDEFDSLDTVSVYVGGDEVVSTTLESGTDRSHHEESFSESLPDTVTETPIRAVAIDDREQAATDSTQQGQPELVSAEFVNTPVDSYHERIDEERYTAVHEMVIELNGADPEDVISQFDYRSDDSEVIQIEDPSANYDPHRDRVVVESAWAAEYPGSYLVDFKIGQLKSPGNEILAEHSPPEVHINIIDPGTDSHDRGYKLLVDPSKSFDPDGSELTFRVGDRERMYPSADEIGIEFSDVPILIATDREGHSTSYELDLYDYYAPEIYSISEVSEGPYVSGDRVLFDVQTEEYQLAAPEYELNTRLQLENGQGSVQSWRVIDPKPSVDNTRDAARQDVVKYKSGRVAVEIESFADGEYPGLRVSNNASTDGRSVRHQLPEIEGIMPKPSNSKATDIEYTVDGFVSERTATSPNERVSLERSGYQVDDSSTETDTVELEERQTDTTHSTETRTFDRESARDGFVSTRTDWTAAGTDTESRTTRETEWVESMSDSSGRYTGETRQVSKYPPQVPSPTTVTEYKFALSVQETVDLYVAENRTEDTTTSWVSMGETTNVGSAYQRANSNHDIRVASTTESTTWELSKLVHETKTVDSYDDPTRVRETSGTVSGDIIEQLPASSARTMRQSKIDEFSVDVSVSGLRSESALIEAATDPESRLDPNCSSEYEEVC